MKKYLPATIVAFIIASVSGLLMDDLNRRIAKLERQVAGLPSVSPIKPKQTYKILFAWQDHTTGRKFALVQKVFHDPVRPTMYRAPEIISLNEL